MRWTSAAAARAGFGPRADEGARCVSHDSHLAANRIALDGAGERPLLAAHAERDRCGEANLARPRDGTVLDLRRAERALQRAAQRVALLHQLQRDGFVAFLRRHRDGPRAAGEGATRGGARPNLDRTSVD